MLFVVLILFLCYILAVLKVCIHVWYKLLTKGVNSLVKDDFRPISTSS